MPNRETISPINPKRNNRPNELNKSGTPTALKPIISASLSVGDLSDIDVGSLKVKIGLLEKDLERRQESYATRERAYKNRITELEEEVSEQRMNKTGVVNTERKMEKLKAMQQQIINNVELVQDRTSRILQEQERDLLRAFRARLFDVQTELEKEKSKKDDGTGAWKEKSAKLEAEMNWAKEVTDRLEHTNQQLLQENHRLKGQFGSQEEDRAFNIRQLVVVKKENSEIKARYAEMEKSRFDIEERLKTVVADKAVAAPRTGLAKNDSDDRYKELNKRLRKLLETERKSLQKERQSYQQELRTRTETELLLRQCVEDVRREISRRHLQAAREAATLRMGQTAADVTVTDKRSVEDHERQLELLLSQERVVSLLYAKTFPVQLKPTMGSTPAPNSTGLVLDEVEATCNSSAFASGGERERERERGGFGGSSIKHSSIRSDK
eukprot:CAMPEP_0182425474 /NCGR_PEP_ID=MMETSP1167-20130531/11901_1 /TAXON_ID=2988 /ORGANISM="Mallomonas Sp, Strain CCMP3275" /LENGTH=439 /DNA_ID=CAMNT_0024606235 /DNA_START=79 /DNA_END=1398 /DNA_ORIENTATION=+